MGHDVIGNLWSDARVIGDLRTTGAGAPTLAVFRGNLRLWQFSSTVLNEAFMWVQLPHDYKQGTDLKLHCHWAHTSGVDNGAVVWAAEASWANTGVPGDVIPVATTYTGAAASVLGADQYKNQITTLGTLTGTGKKISSEIIIRFYRDPTVAGDTSTADIFLLEVDLHYQKDAPGSWAEFTK